jgi:tetratricopeptide (TPR) repeat protein
VKFDKAKVIEKARRYAHKGNLGRAIQMYREVVSQDPTDSHAWLKIAELCKRNGDEAAAVGAYAEVARSYRIRGFRQKAIAAYEQVLRIQPGDARMHNETAEQYAEAGHVADALRHFKSAGELYWKADDRRAALVAFARVVELAPNDLPLRKQLAELYTAAGMHGDAVREYMELAASYLHVGDPLRSLSVLKVCYKSQPDNTDLLTVMAKAFRDAGYHDRAAAVERELERLTGRPALAKGTARQRPNGPTAHQLDKLFTEATSYIKVGLSDRAVPLLRAILQEQPDHEDARLTLERLGAMH